MTNASPKSSNLVHPNPTLNIDIPLYLRGKSKIGGGVTMPY
jgi:hypothetical protein